jgi:hypothetical protein
MRSGASLHPCESVVFEPVANEGHEDDLGLDRTDRAHAPVCPAITECPDPVQVGHHFNPPVDHLRVHRVVVGFKAQIVVPAAAAEWRQPVAGGTGGKLSIAARIRGDPVGRGRSSATAASAGSPE